MSTIAREQLRERAREKVKSLEFAVTQAAFADSRAELEEELELARIALAAQAAGPVYQWRERYIDSDLWDDCTKEQYEGFAKHPDFETRILYTVPPAPVAVPDDVLKGFLPDAEKAEFWFEHNGKILFEGVKFNNAVFDACRAAMLQGAEPVSQHPELTVWYGSMPETNGKTNWTAILHRKGECLSTGITIEISEYPDRVRYEADRVRHIIGELKEEPDILAYDADAHSGYVKTGNSPVIPDGWVACSERMPEDNAEQEVLACFKGGDISTLYYFEGRWDDAYGIVPIRQDVTHWMPLPAAPQQETK